MIYEELLSENLTPEQEEDNFQGIAVLEKLLRFNEASDENLQNFMHLRNLVTRHHEVYDMTGYRGTKFDTHDLYLLLQNKEFTVKPSRPIRSWSLSNEMADQFATHPLDEYTFGVLLEDFIPAEEIIIDLSNEEIIDDFRSYLHEMNAMERKLGHEMSDYDKMMTHNIDRIIGMEGEAEIVRLVNKTKVYKWDENIQRIYINSPGDLEKETQELLSGYIKKNGEQLGDLSTLYGDEDEWFGFSVDTDGSLAYTGKGIS